MFVFDNDHPCVSPSAPSVLEPPAGIYQNRPATGIARVVCFTPRHDVTLAELPHDQFVSLLATLQEQYRELASRPEVDHVLMFENKGEAVGVSNPHPHCQIYATNFVFKTIEIEAEASAAHWAEHGVRCFRTSLPPRSRMAGASSSRRDGALAFVPVLRALSVRDVRRSARNAREHRRPRATPS